MSLQDFWSGVQPALLQLLYVVSLAAISMLTKYGVDWLKSKMSEVEFSTASKWAETIVQFLEQIGIVRGMSNDDKKEYAVNTLQDVLADAGILLDDDQADWLIEAAVQRLKLLQ